MAKDRLDERLDVFLLKEKQTSPRVGPGGVRRDGPMSPSQTSKNYYRWHTWAG